MKKLFLIAISLIAAIKLSTAQKTDTLTVYYFENNPFAYSEKNVMKGIEVEIINEYVNWMKVKKNTTLLVDYKNFKEFSTFYSAVKDGNTKVIGLGSVTITPEREKEVSFTPAYMRNMAVLITDGSVPTIKNKNAAEVAKVLGGLNALVVNKSSHFKYINDIKKLYLPNMKMSFTESQNNILESIATDPKVYGYTDIIAYWSFFKKNQSKFLKIQKTFNQPNEFLGFPVPKKSTHLPYLNEFFESGFGFTSTKMYRQILENYLGYEIIDEVEIK